MRSRRLGLVLDDLDCTMKNLSFRLESQRLANVEAQNLRHSEVKKRKAESSERMAKMKSDRDTAIFPRGKAERERLAAEKEKEAADMARIAAEEAEKRRFEEERQAALENERRAAEEEASKRKKEELGAEKATAAAAKKAIGDNAAWADAETWSKSQLDPENPSAGNFEIRATEAKEAAEEAHSIEAEIAFIEEIEKKGKEIEKKGTGKKKELLNTKLSAVKEKQKKLEACVEAEAGKFNDPEATKKLIEEVENMQAEGRIAKHAAASKALADDVPKVQSSNVIGDGKSTKMFLNEDGKMHVVGLRKPLPRIGHAFNCCAIPDCEECKEILNSRWGSTQLGRGKRASSDLNWNFDMKKMGEAQQDVNLNYVNGFSCEHIDGSAPHVRKCACCDVKAKKASLEPGNGDTKPIDSIEKLEATS